MAAVAGSASRAAVAVGEGRADWTAGAALVAWGVGAGWAVTDAEKASSITPASSDRDDRAVNPLIICCFTIVYEKSNPEIYAGES